MITILKEGKKFGFIAVCSDCGCEFKYDLSDLNAMSSGIYCPCCGKFVLHNDQSKQNPQQTVS